MDGGIPTTAPADESHPQADGGQDFSDQARQAGLVLPTPRKARPVLALLIVAVVIFTSLGVGWETGWLNPAAHPQDSINCNGVSIRLWGGVSESPAPVAALMNSLGSEFANTTTGCGNIDVQYNATAGDGSLAALASRSVDFSVVSELPNQTDLAAFPALTLITPVAVGGLELVVNLPNVSGPVNLSSAALAGIYLGTITSWNDPMVTRMNPGLAALTNSTIHPLFLTGSTGLTDALSTYLAETNATWSSTMGKGPSLNWRTGEGLASDSAMARNLSSTPGAIGYLEQGTAIGQGMKVAQVENSNGSYLVPTPGSISTAVQSALLGLPAAQLTLLANGTWANVSVVNAPGAGSYPIPVLSYLVVYGDLGQVYGAGLSGLDARMVSVLIWWMVSSGQSYATGVGLPALPSMLTQYGEHGLSELSYDGQPLYPISNGEGGEGNGNETNEF